MYKYVFGFLTASVIAIIGFNLKETNPTQKQNQKLTSIQKFDRSIASKGEQLVLDINDKIISITDPDQIIPLIDELKSLATENQDNYTVRLYNAIFSPLKELKGVIWRMRPFVEDSQAMHIFSLGQIRKLYYADYLYGPHIKAVLDYLTSPVAGTDQFNTVSDLQYFLKHNLQSQLDRSLEEVDKIIAEAPEEWRFKIDAYLATGYQKAKNPGEKDITYISDSKRYEKSFIKSYSFYVKGALHRIIGGINYIYNYNLDNIAKLSNDILIETALNSRTKWKKKPLKRPAPSTPKELVRILNYAKHSKFLTRRVDQDEADKNLQVALEHFIAATESDLMALKESHRNSDLSLADTYFINPHLIHIDYNDNLADIEGRLNILKEAKTKQTSSVASEATGETIKINTHVIFTSHEDLKSFLPLSGTEGFGDIKAGSKGNKGRKPSSGSQSSGMEDLWAWNYYYGLPVRWKDPTFGNLLPTATNENMYHLMRSLKLSDVLSGFTDLLPIP